MVPRVPVWRAAESDTSAAFSNLYGGRCSRFSSVHPLGEKKFPNLSARFTYFERRERGEGGGLGGAPFLKGGPGLPHAVQVSPNRSSLFPGSLG